MNYYYGAECNACPSQSGCATSSFRQVAAAYGEIRDFIKAKGPPSGTDCLNAVMPNDQALREMAANLVAARRQRERYIPAGLLGEPAWDILLELYSHKFPQSMKAVAVGAGVPMTSTLRWVALLDRHGLVTQSPDPNDRRRTLAALTENGLAALSSALGAMQTAMIDPAERL
jgi:DNA-binding MarR family transcriptional regulator